MKNILNTLFVTFVMVLLTGCMTATYVKPTHIDQKNKYRLTVNTL